ncbi:MAG: hypothetical protein AMXMBFR59_04090 [Rhodanobacteraceae bacterium]
MGKQTNVNLKHQNSELTVSQTSTDAPILPIAQIERLKEIAPDRVDWLFDETSKEGNFRRGENRRINTLVYLERTLGQLFGFLIGMGGLAAATYMAVNGAETAACVVGGTTVVGLVSAFLFRKRGSSSQPSSKDK